MSFHTKWLGNTFLCYKEGSKLSTLVVFTYPAISGFFSNHVNRDSSKEKTCLVLKTASYTTPPSNSEVEALLGKTFTAGGLPPKDSFDFFVPFHSLFLHKIMVRKFNEGRVVSAPSNGTFVVTYKWVGRKKIFPLIRANNGDNPLSPPQEAELSGIINNLRSGGKTIDFVVVTHLHCRIG